MQEYRVKGNCSVVTMLTIILWIPGNWVVVVESRTPFRGSYQIKWSDTSYAGLPEDVAEEHHVIKRIPGKRNQDGHLIVLSLSVQYSLHSHTENILRTSPPPPTPMGTGDSERPTITTDRANTSSTTILGPQRTTGATASFPTRTSNLDRHGLEGASMPAHWPCST